MFFISRRIKLHLAIIALISIGGQLPIGGQTRRALATLSPEEVAKRVMPSVVSIRMTDGSKSQSGSGFFVSPDTIVTNFHVIESMTSGTVKIVGGTRTYSISGVVGYDKETDLALIQISASIGKSLVLASSEKPAVGAAVYAVGNPRGLEGTFSPGIVSGLRDFSDGSLIQITAPISPGSSGGPVVNNKAEVVGIAVGSRESGQALNFAIPVSALKTLQLNKHVAVTVRHAGLNLAKPSPRVAEVKPIPPPRSITLPTPTPRPITIVPESTVGAKATEADQILWNEVSKQNTKESYAFYLREQPQGAYASEARRRITAFDEAREKARWDVAVVGNSKGSFESFLNEFPSGRFALEAKERIKQFDSAEEDRVWESAEYEKTVVAYIKYLGKYPSGIYASVAKLRLLALGVSFTVPYGSGGPYITNRFGMQLAWIPPGNFMMGSTATDLASLEAECKRLVSTCTYKPTDEGPERRVTIARGFWMGRYEVTQGQYEAVMGTNPSKFKICGKDCPVETVSWNDAKEFIAKLNTGNDGFVYSLPSEAEWEYAARAGTTGIRHGNLEDIAWFVDNAGDRRVDGIKIWLQDSKGNWDSYTKILFDNGNRTRRVGLKQPNAWGLHDMLGNVWEWVEDIYQNSYTGLPTDGSANTTRGDSSFRVLRGGSWGNLGGDARVAYRGWNGPAYQGSGAGGFRVVARAR